VNQTIAYISLVVADYDHAIDFYMNKLGFDLIEDTYQEAQQKRWVVVAPPGSRGTQLLLAQAKNPDQSSRIGNQAGGRVFLFLHTDDFHRDYDRFVNNGVEFVRPPSDEPYGTVAVFKDLYGNLWDLLQPTPKAQKE
jgi:catechol 2,3-dioxygenase-like lactoylglutathione lyase family enzyme